MASVSLNPDWRALDVRWVADGSLEGRVDVCLTEFRRGRWIPVSQVFTLDEDPCLSIAREGEAVQGLLKLDRVGDKVRVRKGSKLFGLVGFDQLNDVVQRCYVAFDRYRSTLFEVEA